MDEKGVTGTYLSVSEEKSDSLYPMYFGISCAFFAIRLLSGADSEDKKWYELHDRMLKGSAQLLGLLVWRVQREEANWEKCMLLDKLGMAKREIEELKKLRHEDAKANEKVAGIFAEQEQSWFNEKKKLREHIGALINDLRVVGRRKDEAISELNEKFKEMEFLVQSKDKVIEEDEQKRKELEENLANAEKIAEELRESAKQEAQEHSNEIRKHKTAFIELVSNQRQLEAEMGRTLRQLESAKQELELVLEQKEESVLLAQKLSLEIVKMQKDLDQKEKILSAMLRKSKLDTAEKQLLLKEVKFSKAKRKQAELETERWKAASQSRHERHSLRSMLISQASSRLDVPSGAQRTSHVGKTRSQQTDYILECEHLDLKNDPDLFSPPADYYSAEGKEEQAEVKRLQGWVRLEAEKYATVIEKRHHLELEAFADQMRLKEEKLDSYRWRLLSMEIESKRLQSHVEGLNQDMSQLRHENMKLEALLLEREEELYSLKEQYVLQLKPFSCQKTILNSSLPDPALINDAVWCEEKIMKRRSKEKEQELETSSMERCQGNDTDINEENRSNNASKNVIIVQSPEEEFEEKNDAVVDVPIQEEKCCLLEVDTFEKIASSSQSLSKTNNFPLRMDLHALGVSCKIKRLKQLLVMLERFTGNGGEHTKSNDNVIKGFLLLISLLNKQVSRYQSLQGKIDDLCKRMHETDSDLNHEDSITTKRKGDTKALEHFLEETFQLQRYIVSTGQKLIEVQSKIASGFVELPEELDKFSSFDKKRFADNLRTLFQEVQRGLEVRVARIIGDLEGTLACEGMIHLRR